MNRDRFTLLKLEKAKSGISIIAGKRIENIDWLETEPFKLETNHCSFPPRILLEFQRIKLAVRIVDVSRGSNELLSSALYHK